jgi:hypothetical protein
MGLVWAGTCRLTYTEQHGSKSVSPFTHRDSFSNPLSKYAKPITATLSLNPFLGSILLEDARVARIGPETMKRKEYSRTPPDDSSDHY